jgi:hypothetical protein
MEVLAHEEGMEMYESWNRPGKDEDLEMGDKDGRGPLGHMAAQASRPGSAPFGSGVGSLP